MNQSRHPRGVPAGGQFAAGTHAEVGIALHEPQQRTPRTVAVTKVIAGQERIVEVAYLTTPGEQWSPPPPDAVLTLDEVLELKPTDQASTWAGVERFLRAERPEYLDRLVDSISELGIQTPIEIEGGSVERGHHRVVAARIAGVSEVPVVFGRREEAWEWVAADDSHRPYEYHPDDFDDLDDW